MPPMTASPTAETPTGRVDAVEGITYAVGMRCLA